MFDGSQLVRPVNPVVRGILEAIGIDGPGTWRRRGAVRAVRVVWVTPGRRWLVTRLMLPANPIRAHPMWPAGARRAYGPVSRVE
ncbi:hypothetical protein A5636_05675 [Mycobacterium asiaticum]|uniref:Uncharacterized protein n=1 Tax=Mycobacterium asiaticum TaxID=1790 RepID=A0A1A3N273_MYCAS|nr:hypothetical protein A5636_05675 [Mycobacterium asiaticum]